MDFNLVDIHYLIAAICVITSALVFYSVGVWSERLQEELKAWHLVFFLLGLCADFVGTGLMEHIAKITNLNDRVHTITGTIALALMLVHAVWALWTYFRGSARAKAHFNRFSILVWCIWLVPYCIGVFMGMCLDK